MITLLGTFKDGYPYYDLNTIKSEIGLQSGCLIADSYINRNGKKYVICHCIKCGLTNIEVRWDNFRAGAAGGITYSSGRFMSGTRSHKGECSLRNKYFKEGTCCDGLKKESHIGAEIHGWKVIKELEERDSNGSKILLVQSLTNSKLYDKVSWRHLNDGFAKHGEEAKYNQEKAEKRKYGYGTLAEAQNAKFHTNQKIADLLTKNNITFKREYSFYDCKDTLPLPFDFAVKYNNQYSLIEYDGEQHFYAIDFFGGEERFQDRKKKDTIKNNYCFKNNIRLLRIPYTVNLDSITIQDLTIGNRFVVTPSNIKEYYKIRD